MRMGLSQQAKPPLEIGVTDGRLEALADPDGALRAEFSGSPIGLNDPDLEKMN